MKRPVVKAKTSEGYDPFTAEIIRMGLDSICNEMAITMTMTSGSPVLTEAQDFSTALLTPAGEHLAYAGYVTLHIASSLLGTRSVIQSYPPGEIGPGDQLMSNDPYKGGACHSADNYVVKPIFWGEELICWAYSGGHILDVGGADPGGWSPTSYDMFGEALHIPPLKIVRGGKLNQDLCAMIENNVRLPRLYINDLKSFIAANNTAENRLTKIIQERGLKTFQDYCAYNQQLSENMMRERIQKMPDGTYSTTDWLEHDGHENKLFKVKCALTIRGSDLYLDFSGSDPQGLGGINASFAGLVGGVWTAIVQLLAYDIPFNAGVMRPVHIYPGDEGTVTNPKRPAATAVGHIDAGSKAGKMVTELLSQAFACSKDQALREKVSGQFQDCFSANVWSVTDQYGKPTLIGNMDAGGAGGPAQTCCDGLDAAAMMCQVNNSLPDVESNESIYPMLYLWKRLQPDSGGPGTFRGGLGLDFAWILWDTDSAQGILNACTRQVPPRGMFGGLPPTTSCFRKLTNTNLPQLFSAGIYPTCENVRGEAEALPPKAFPVSLHRWEIFHQWCGGGSGLGDPLLREPERVKKDLMDGYISAEQAVNAYGVIVDPGTGEVNRQATDERRAGIRRDRLYRALGAKPSLDPLPVKTSPRKSIRPLSPCLLVFDEDVSLFVGCVWCGGKICRVGEDWRLAVAVLQNEVALRLQAWGIWVQAREWDPLLLIEYLCPHCGTLLDSTVVRQGEPDTRFIRPYFLDSLSAPFPRED